MADDETGSGAMRRRGAGKTNFSTESSVANCGDATRVIVGHYKSVTAVVLPGSSSPEERSFSQ